MILQRLDQKIDGLFIFVTRVSNRLLWKQELRSEFSLTGTLSTYDVLDYVIREQKYDTYMMIRHEVSGIEYSAWI